MSRIKIEIAGDYDSRAVKEATAALQNMDKVTVAGATKSVERLSAQRAKLQEVAGAYRALAATSEQGSAQQVAAANLAAKAEARLAGSIQHTGTTARHSGNEIAFAERQVGKFTRGTLEATGAFGKFGAALALGSGGFIVGAGIAEFGRSTLEATKELVDNQQQLQVALKNSGISWDTNKGQIEEYLTAEKKLSAFDDAVLMGSMIGLVRASGSVTKAEKDTALAADIARGAHKDLATVTQTLIALEAGRTRGVQALGIKLPVVKTAQDALTASGKQFTAEQHAQAAQLDQVAAAQQAIILLREKYSGSAKRYSDSEVSATERLHVSINSLQESIGLSLLPEVQAIAGPFAKWAEKEAESGDAAAKVKTAVHDLVAILKTGKTVIEDVDKVTGGFKNTLELLIGLKLTAWALGAVAAFTTVGTAEGAAAGKATLLRSAWLKLGAADVLVALAAPLAILNLLQDKSKAKNFQGTQTGAQVYQGANGQWVQKFGRAGVRNITPEEAIALGASAPGLSATTGNGGLLGSTTGSLGMSPAQKRAYIAAQAARLGLDPRAVLGVATAEGGFSGAVGDGGHAYGPFQLNNAGGVITGMYPGKNSGAAQTFANSQAGIDFALKAMAKVAGGLKGMAAISAIVSKFERPKDSTHDLSAASAYYFGKADTGAPSASNAAAIAALIAGGKSKPAKTVSGSALIGDKLLNAITLDKNNASTTTGSVAEMWLHRELDNLQKARADVAAKLKGASPKQATAINAELRTIDTQIAGVNKSITSNLKSQADAIKKSAASLIAADKQAITSAMSNIITDAQTAFSAATQAYITNTLGPKFLQGGLLTPKEQRLADMQAADTAKSLADGLTAAQKQLADDLNGSLIEHIVDISTGATKDIFGPQGSSDQIALDRQAVDQAQRMIDENNLSIEATAERKDADKNYAAAVNQYQQERTDAEHAMTRELTNLGQGIANGTNTIGDLNGVLAQFGLSVTDIPTDQFTSDMGILSGAVADLAQTMIAESIALSKLSGGGGQAASDRADALLTSLSVVNTRLADAGVYHPSELDPAIRTRLYSQIPHMATGGDILRDGLIYAHRGERVQPADVVRGSRGGGNAIIVNVNAPNYVGSHDELASALKHPSVLESVSTAVIMGGRRGHIRQGDLPT